MKVAIIKYNAGNVLSVQHALQRLGVKPIITDNADEIAAADKVIFPGVGEASTAMAYLKERALDNVIRDIRQPLLGICLGMQLLCQHSEENHTDCLGIFPLKVRRFSDEKKVPQIGWNAISELRSPLFSGVKNDDFVYFVHGFYVENSQFSIAKTEYGISYSSAINRENFFATQFHPEKSGAVGEKILENFLKLC